MDKAVRLAISLQNGALAQLGLARKIKVQLVDSQDGQSQASASVEAAKKEVGEHANVIIGEMASSATIPMAQSVTIPNHVVLISPTASAPQITALKDNGYVWQQTYDFTLTDTFMLPPSALAKFGKGNDQRRRAQRRVRHGAPAALRRAVEEARRQGRRLHLMEPGPADVRYGGAAARLRQPKGWVIIDFPETFQKFAPSLVRTGKWSARRPRDRGAEERADARRDRKPGRRPERNRCQRRRRTGRQRVPQALEPVGARREAVPGSRERRSTPRTSHSRRTAWLSSSLAKIRNNLIPVSGPRGRR
jgi:hypothetical protein